MVDLTLSGWLFLYDVWLFGQPGGCSNQLQSTAMKRLKFLSSGVSSLLMVTIHLPADFCSYFRTIFLHKGPNLCQEEPQLLGIPIKLHVQWQGFMTSSWWCHSHTPKIICTTHIVFYPSISLAMLWSGNWERQKFCNSFGSAQEFFPLTPICLILYSATRFQLLGNFFLPPCGPASLS